MQKLGLRLFLSMFLSNIYLIEVSKNNTMKHLKFIPLLLMITSTLLLSCGNDPLNPTCNSDEFNASITSAGESLETALNAFIADPENSDKCEDFRSAGLKYVDELEDLFDCARILNRDQEIQQAINAYKMSYEDIEC